MAERKAVATVASVAGFIASVGEDQQRADSEALLKLLADITGEGPVSLDSGALTTATQAAVRETRVYVKRLSDVDPTVLRRLVEAAAKQPRR
jgi:hypothetical protein